MLFGARSADRSSRFPEPACRPRPRDVDARIEFTPSRYAYLTRSAPGGYCQERWKKGLMASLSILIVDDDHNVAELLGLMFSREGFAPRILRDGRAAHDYVARNEPAAAVVLDVMLPYRDGFAVAEAIRADVRWRHVPIVMLSARVASDDVARGRALGVSEHVTKPFHPQAIVERVKTLLSAARSTGG